VVDYDHDIFLRTTQVRWFNPVSTLFKTLTYTYDDASNRASMTGAEGEVVSYSYDANNLLLSISRQKGTSSAQFLSIVYDAGNRRRSMTFGNGVTETFLRDIKGQILRLLHTRSDGSVVSSVSYTYDDMGTRKSMSWDHLGVTGTFGYDGLYRLISESWSGNRGQVGFVNSIGPNIGNESGYSPVGKGTPAALTEVAAHYQAYTFDRWGNRLTLNGNSRTASVSYDNENRINQESPGTMSKITGTTAAASDTEAGFTPAKANDGDITDAANSTYAWRSQDVTGEHWLEISWASAKTVKQVRVYIPTSPGTVQRFKVQYWDGFAWVDANVLTAVNASASGGWYSTSYHENLFRITPVSTTKVRYLQDSGGGASGSPNIAWLNELEAYEDVAGSVVSYTHDSNGNVTKRQTDANNYEDFGYDYANRLNLYKKTVSGSVTVHYTYLAAPTGDRFRKRNELATGGTIQDYQFVYDARDCVADYEKPANGSLGFVRDYVQRNDTDTKIARVESDGTARYYAGDALGSVTHLLDSAAAVLNTTLTNAWGESMVTSQPTADRFGFTQRENDNESGLMHYRARWYDPRLGRFGGKDALLERVSMHYVYANNRPLDRKDPLGLQTDWPGPSFEDDWRVHMSRNQKRIGTPKKEEDLPEQVRDPDWRPKFGSQPSDGTKPDVWLIRKANYVDQTGFTDILLFLLDDEYDIKDQGLFWVLLEDFQEKLDDNPSYVINGPKSKALQLLNKLLKAAVRKVSGKRSKGLIRKARYTKELPKGQVRTPEENAKAREYYKNHREEAMRRWEERTGKKWPKTKDGQPQWAEHPRALSHGGDPLYVEPGKGPDPNAAHNIPGPDGLTDSQRWGKMGTPAREANKSPKNK
jgi:RHS repeat-associated protein